MKKLFSKKKNKLKKANKLQINQIFNRRIKSYLKKDSLWASLISCIKLLNPPFSPRFQNNSRTHFFFLFPFFAFFIKNKATSCKNKMSSSSGSHVISKELQNLDLIYYNVNLITDVFQVILKYCWKIIAKYRQILPFVA